jgi:hypothetical protein
MTVNDELGMTWKKIVLSLLGVIEETLEKRHLDGCLLQEENSAMHCKW